MERFARFGALCLFFWALCSCQPAQQASSTLTTDNVDGGSLQDITRLLRQAEAAPEHERITLQLTAMEALLAAGNTDWARTIAADLDPAVLETLPPFAAERARWALVEARLALAAGDSERALSIVSAPPLEAQLAAFPVELAVQIRELRASILFNRGNYLDAVDERIHLIANYTADADAALINRELLWQSLMELSLEQLQTAADQGQSRTHRGWYELAVISKNNQNNLREQLAQLDAWQQQYPAHPASVNLPADLQLLRELVANQPRQLAVLLPASGRLEDAATAIKNGLLAAFYQYQAVETEAPEIRFYDTEGGDIVAIYQRAISEGAEIVIGPLEKDKIAQLAELPLLAVPTLALNTIDAPPQAATNLYQFGLRVEDEAQLAAQKAWRDGHRRVLIIAPNNLWGDRCSTAFRTAWQALGGEYAADHRFEDKNDYSKVIQHALHIDASQTRARRMRDLIGQLEFEPRRRQDIDAIFIAAQAPQARQIKPTLAFHYAGNLPVYATSHVYEGVKNTKLDQDMNGVYFSTLPWYFNNKLAEKASLMASPNAAAKLQPLYALGVDSFYLYPRLKQLQTIKGARFYGQTGTLELAPSGQILRQQVWAQFSNGRAKKLAEPD